MFRSKPSAKSEDAITVVIGKTFESTTLPDGSQQITEVTKYKRLNDGFIYTEKKLRQVVEDDKSEATSAHNTTPGSTRSNGGFRLSLNTPKNNTNKDNADDDAKYNVTKEKDAFPDLTCPSSLTLSNSSSSEDTMDVNIMKVVMENHHDEESTRGEDFVEEYLYGDNDENLRRSLSPRQHNISNRNNGSGWCANADDQDEENSLQLVKGKVKRMWSPQNPIRRILHSSGDVDTNGFPQIKKLFHNGDTTHHVDLNGFPRIIENEDEEESSDGSKALRALRPSPPSSSCREKMRAKKYKLLIVTIVAALAVTAVATILYRSSEREEVTMYSVDVGMDGESNAENEGTATADEEVIIAPACINLKIVLSTDKHTGDSEHNDGDDSNWKLTRKQGEKPVATIASGGSLGPNEKHTIEDCVAPGVYTFHVTDSGGNGLGAQGSGGYYIIANGIKLGVSSFFFHDEEMTFTLPFEGDEYDGDKDTACADDFFLAIKTDDHPDETNWNVVDNESGDTVLEGGPYALPWAVYTQRACLPNGNYSLIMMDAGGDGVCCDNGQGFFVLSSDGNTIADSDGRFGSSHSSIFLLGNGTMVEKYEP